MKYIKLFEIAKDKEIKPKFKVGDFVYVIDKYSGGGVFLEENKKYEISSYYWHEDQILYQLKEIPDSGFFEYRFISELEYNVSKYNL